MTTVCQCCGQNFSGSGYVLEVGTPKKKKKALACEECLRVRMAQEKADSEYQSDLLDPLSRWRSARRRGRDAGSAA
jgi:hypothetical protein